MLVLILYVFGIVCPYDIKVLAVEDLDAQLHLVTAHSRHRDHLDFLQYLDLRRADLALEHLLEVLHISLLCWLRAPTTI